MLLWLSDTFSSLPGWSANASHRRVPLPAVGRSDQSGVSRDDTVVEVGPGIGTLTKFLSERVKRVIAIEFDNFIRNSALLFFSTTVVASLTIDYFGVGHHFGN